MVTKVLIISIKSLCKTTCYSLSVQRPGKRLFFSYNKVLLQKTDLLWTFLNKYRLFGSEHFPTKTLNFSQKIVKQLVSGCSVKKEKKEKKSDLWLCNQTSRQILIFSKLFPSFHYDFKSFHLDLVYTEHHQTVPVFQPQSFKKLMLYLCYLAIWAFLAHKALTHLSLMWIRNEWPGLFSAENPNNFLNDSSCMAALVHDPPRKPHFKHSNRVSYPSIKGMGRSERGKTSKAGVQKRCSPHTWASKYPFLFILRLPHQIFPDILYSNLDTFK